MIRRRVARRSFLRGLGASAISLPLLSMGLGSQVWADDLVANGFPRRFIYFFHPNGTMHDEWWPDVQSETNFSFRQILSPLQPWRDKLIIPKGLDLHAGRARYGPGEPHQRGMAALLTGKALQEGDFVGGDGSRAGWGDGISLDQYIAQHIGQDNAYESLLLGIRSDTTAPAAEVRTRLSYAGPAQPLAPINDPLEVFRLLFSDALTDDAALDNIREDRRSILDAVRGQFTAVESRVGMEDRQRLERHKEMIRDLERRLAMDGVTGEHCYISTQPPEQEPDHEDTMPEISRLQIDLAVMAMACDMTRVVGLQYSNAKNHIRFPWVDSRGDGHWLSHAGPSNEQAHSEWVVRDRWFAEQFAYLLERLDAIPEGDGTMLDNSVIIWMNELSVGNTHTNDNMPFVLAGGGGGMLRTGQFVDFGSRSHSDLLLTFLRVFGLQNETFGDERFCTGPLDELLVS